MGALCKFLHCTTVRDTLSSTGTPAIDPGLDPKINKLKDFIEREEIQM